jgi:crotonobetainyl-CoA:carnitine CoA-transferase CaiB-like acyl-CoA transferase
MAPRIAAYVAGEPEPAPTGGTDSVLAVYQPFQAADRTIVVAIGNDLMWRRFCRALGLDDLAQDPGLVDNPGRREHRSRVTARIEEVLARRPAREWLDLLAGVGVPAAPVQSLSEVVSDPQVVDRGAVLPVPGSDGHLVTVRSPFRLASIPQPRNERFPALGAHTADVLAELGYTPSDLARLAACGAIAGPGLDADGLASAKEVLGA